jgi:hypothetical protein
LSKEQKESLRKLLARALNKNQLIILSEIENNSQTLTSFLIKLSKATKIPLSTLKFNAKVLKQLGIITFADFSNAELTKFGKIIFTIIGGESPR